MIRNSLLVFSLLLGHVSFADESQTWFQSIKLLIIAAVKTTHEASKEIKKHCEDHGAGQQAIKDNEALKNIAITSTNALEKFADANEQSTEGINSIAAAANKSVETQSATNEILRAYLKTKFCLE